ncbi:MAG: ABC transporter permease subunit [Natronomonas sp.]|uniref:ABC transporter permease n=1 Tax=Natronomonas sp. TaxID=2184060 RepID=UPI0028708BB2|nr:ABC transporter permease subunit [Natronomonas sp.]MDR9431599.1 ABC transporter permease subunit [Natronomonas sp.]
MSGGVAQKLGEGLSGTGRMPIGNTRRTRWALSILGVVSWLVAWQTLPTTLGLEPTYFPRPTDVYTELARIYEPILAVIPNTLWAALVGFLLSLVLSIVVAAVLVANDSILEALMPFIVGTNTIPRIAMTPLVIYWVGFLPWAWVDLSLANYIMALWVAFFPMLIAAMGGFRDIDEDTKNMLEVYGATEWQALKYVRFKNGLPFIFDGMKIGFILAMVGAVVGEFVSASPGIGSMAASALSRTSISRAVSIVLILGLISSSLVLAIYLVESRVIFWRESSVFGGEE